MKAASLTAVLSLSTLCFSSGCDRRDAPQPETPAAKTLPDSVSQSKPESTPTGDWIKRWFEVTQRDPQLAKSCAGPLFLGRLASSELSEDGLVRLIESGPRLPAFSLGLIKGEKAQLAALKKIDLAMEYSAGILPDFEDEKTNPRGLLTRMAATPAVVEALGEYQFSLDRRVEIVLPGNIAVGRVEFLAQIHHDARNSATRCERAVMSSQTQIFRLLQELSPKNVFNEGLEVSSLPSFDQRQSASVLVEVLSRSPNRLPDVERIVAVSGAAVVYSGDSEKISLHPANSEALQMRTAEILGDGSAVKPENRAFIFEERERDLGGILLKFFERNPGSNCALVYGADHDLNQADFGELRKDQLPVITRHSWPGIEIMARWDLQASVISAAMSVSGDPLRERAFARSLHSQPPLLSIVLVTDDDARAILLGKISKPSQMDRKHVEVVLKHVSSPALRSKVMALFKEK